MSMNRPAWRHAVTKTVLFFSLAVFISTAVFSAIPIRAYAFDPTNPTDLIKSYEYYYAVARCIESPYNVNDIANNNFTNTAQAGSIVGVSHLIDPTDGEQQCSTIMPAAISFWGYGSAGAALSDWGFKVSSSGGISSWKNDKPGTGFASAIRAKFYNGNAPQLTDALKYVLYSQSFLVGCQAGNGVDYNSADPGQKAAIDANNNGWLKTTLAWGDPPTATVRAYQIGLDPTNIITITAEGSTIDNAMECQTLANIIPRYVQAYITTYGKNSAVNSTIQNSQIQAEQKNNNSSQSSLCGGWPTDSFSWISCPVSASLAQLSSFLSQMLVNLLYTPTDMIFGTTNPASGASSQAFYNTWKIFRNVGLALVVIAALVMVGSQALGWEILDAYTIRKLLPRMGAALIGIALSWPLLKIGVTFFNDLGVWTHTILTAPFQHLPNNFSDPTKFISEYLLAGAVLGGVGQKIIVELGANGFMSLVFVTAAALLIGLAVLAIRYLMIVFAILTAPLAIAAYVLPGTQKVWGLWKNMLFPALVIFIIIMAFIALGQDMSAVVATQAGSLNGANTTNAATIGWYVLALLLYIAPYLLLPFSFKLAGGLMSTVFSLANDRSRGLFDRQRKKREGIREDRRKRAESNALWDPNSRLQRALGANSWASMMTDPMGNIAHAGRNIPGLRKGGNRIESAINASRTEQTGKLFEELNNKYGYNDKAYRLLSGAHGDLSEKTRKELDRRGLLGRQITSLNDLQSAADVLANSDDGAERLASNSIRNSAGRLATLNRDPEMMRANVTAAGMMGLAAHGFASSQDIADSGNLLMRSKSQGGSELSEGAAQSLVVQSQVMGARGRPDVKAGYGIVFNKGAGGKKGSFESGLTAQGDQNRAQALLGSLSAQDMAGAKSGAFKALKPYISNRLNAGGDAAVAQREQLFSWAGPYSQASADIKEEALRYIRNTPGLQDEFDRYNARTSDPSLRGVGGGDPAATGAGGPGGPGGTGGAPSGGAGRP